MPLETCSALSQIDARLQVAWMPGDWLQLTPLVLGHYARKAAVLDGYRPKRAIEIGTRCGYSLVAFSAVSPDTSWLAIDGGLDTDSRQCLAYWQENIDRFNIDARLVVADSHDIRQVGPADFAHVDGDHSYDGCLFDLWLVAHVPLILADDYDNPEVAKAVAAFAGETRRKVEVYSDGLRMGAIIK